MTIVSGEFINFNPRARGEPDSALIKVLSLPVDFNPRARGEPDLIFCFFSNSMSKISIRGLAGSPTICIICVSNFIRIFQSAGSRGARQCS